MTVHKRHHAPEHALSEEAKAARSIIEALRQDGHDDGELVADTVEGETSLLEAIDAADAEMRECAIIAEGCKAVEGEIRTRRQRAEARMDKLRAAVEQALLISGVSDPITRPAGTFSLARLPAQIVVDDESQIPARFFVPQPPKLDKAALKEAAAQGAIPGCHMTNGSVALKVRRK